ncbi:MAG: hypothetical protein Q8K63_15980, partial [Acidimicrobiales bacterium]|nr:hypothetical protein [Acidimicrobiales bacterium]
MAFASDPAFLALHVLRVRGVTPTAEIASACGFDDEIVTALMDDHLSHDFVILRTGNLAGWALTRFGRDEDAQLAR